MIKSYTWKTIRRKKHVVSFSCANNTMYFFKLPPLLSPPLVLGTSNSCDSICTSRCSNIFRSVVRVLELQIRLINDLNSSISIELYSCKRVKLRNGSYWRVNLRKYRYNMYSIWVIIIYIICKDSIDLKTARQITYYLCITCFWWSCLWSVTMSVEECWSDHWLYLSVVWEQPLLFLFYKSRGL